MLLSGSRVTPRRLCNPRLKFGARSPGFQSGLKCAASVLGKVTTIPPQQIKRVYCQPPLPIPVQIKEPVLPAIEEFFKQTFRGISQMVFLENAAAGCAILGAVAAAAPAHGLVLFSGSFLSILFGRILKVNQNDLSTGLISFNGILTGLGLVAFTGLDWTLPLYFIPATLAVVYLYDRGCKLVAPLNIPILSLPFISAMLVILCVKPALFSFTPVDLPTQLHLNEPMFMMQQALLTVPLTVSQCFFTPNLKAGIAILSVMLATNYKVALSAASGAAIGLLTGMVMGFDVTSGLWGFNSALTAMCLYPTFGKSFSSAMFGAFLASATYPLAICLFGSFGLPALSFTFVSSTISCLVGLRLMGK